MRNDAARRVGAAESTAGWERKTDRVGAGMLR